MRRSAPILALTLAATLAAPAVAGEGEKKKPELQAIDLSPVGLPIVYKGRLVNYVFVTVRVDLQPSADTPKERSREPYYRDALVRQAHRTPFVDLHDLTRINEPALRAAMLPAAIAIGGRAIKAVVVVSQQPQRRTGLPRLDGAPAPAPRPIIP